MARHWIEAVLKESIQGPFVEALKSGVILCRLLNVISPGIIPKISTTNIAYQQMVRWCMCILTVQENIRAYLKACHDLGLRELSLFETVDLYEGKNINLVINSIHALAAHVSKLPSFKGPYMEEEDLEKTKNLFSVSLIPIDLPFLSSGSGAETLTDRQSEVFAWFNDHLEADGVPIATGFGDLRSAVKLLQLLKAVTRVSSVGPFDEKPTNLWQCMQNASLVLRFLFSQTLEKIQGCNARDIVNGNIEALTNLLEYIRAKFDLEYYFDQLVGEYIEAEDASQTISPEKPPRPYSTSVLPSSAQLRPEPAPVPRPVSLPTSVIQPPVVAPKSTTEDKLVNPPTKGSQPPPIVQPSQPQTLPPKQPTETPKPANAQPTDEDTKKHKEKKEKKEKKHKHSDATLKKEKKEKKHLEQAESETASNPDPESKHHKKEKKEKKHRHDSEHKEKKEKKDKKKKSERKESMDTTSEVTQPTALPPQPALVIPAQPTQPVQPSPAPVVPAQPAQVVPTQPSPAPVAPAQPVPVVSTSEPVVNTEVSESPKPNRPSKPRVINKMNSMRLPPSDERVERAQFSVRQKIASELFHTEKTYVQSLQSAEQFHQTIIKSKSLNDEELFHVFGNLTQLVVKHQQFLASMTTILSDWKDNSGLGDFFLQKLDFISEYKTYIHNYNASFVACNYLAKKNAAFNKQVESFEVDQRKFSFLNLESFLIMPVQRVPRYILLLKDLLKYTPERHQDFKTVPQALEVIKKHMDDINSGIDKEELDQAKRIQQIEKTIDGDFEVTNEMYLELIIKTFLKPKRRYVKEGNLMWRLIKENKSKKPLIRNQLVEVFGKKKLDVYPYWILFNDILVCCETKKHPEGEKLFDYKATIPLVDILEIHAIRDEYTSKKEEKEFPRECSFSILLEGDLWTVHAKEPTERDKWINELTLAVMHETKKLLLKETGERKRTQ